MLKLLVVIVSTRPGRVGLPVGTWFFGHAKQHARFDVELVDLKELALPFLDEPKHPRFRTYEHDHTKAWSATVDAADAFVFVTPEYNFGVPAPLVNALDYLFVEWGYKPAAFVSYGGMSGGVRSVQMAKQLLTTLKVMPLPEAVAIPMVAQHLDKATGAFQPAEPHVKSASDTLDELHRWATALKTMRG